MLEPTAPLNPIDNLPYVVQGKRIDRVSQPQGIVQVQYTQWAVKLPGKEQVTSVVMTDKMDKGESPTTIAEKLVRAQALFDSFAPEMQEKIKRADKDKNFDFLNANIEIYQAYLDIKTQRELKEKFDSL